MPTPSSSSAGPSFLSASLNIKSKGKDRRSQSPSATAQSVGGPSPITRPPRKSSIGIPFQRDASEPQLMSKSLPSARSSKRQSMAISTPGQPPVPIRTGLVSPVALAPTISAATPVAFEPASSVPPPPPAKTPTTPTNKQSLGSTNPPTSSRHRHTASVGATPVVLLSPKTKRMDIPQPTLPNSASSAAKSTKTRSHSSPKPSSGKTSTSPKATKATPASSSSSKKPLSVVGSYQLHKTLGSGSMGKVKLAMNIHTGQVFACKIIPANKTSCPDPQAVIEQRTQMGPGSENSSYQISVTSFEKGCFKTFQRPMTKADMDESRILREIQFSFLLRHPSIVPLHEVVVTPDYYYLFFDYVQGGQLLDFIIAHGRIKEKYARSFMRQLVSAVEYCHAHSVVHRDLKIENVLIDKKGKIKLIDFGLANVYAPNHLLSTFCGSLYFAAPELLSAKRYIGPEVDVWSLGVIMFVLVCGRVPFDDSSLTALHARIKSGVVEYPAFLSPDCTDLLKRMLVVNPFQRATLKEIKYHPWMMFDHNGAADPHIPQRPDISLPLDLSVIQHMGGLDLGSPDRIYDKLEAWAKGDREIKYSRAYTNSLVKTGLIKGPDVPLVPLYHLIKEHLERLEAKKQKTAAASTSAETDKDQQPAPSTTSGNEKGSLLRRVSLRAKSLFNVKTSPVPSKVTLPNEAQSIEVTPITPPRTNSDGPTSQSTTPDNASTAAPLPQVPIPAEPPSAVLRRRPSQQSTSSGIMVKEAKGKRPVPLVTDVSTGAKSNDDGSPISPEHHSDDDDRFTVVSRRKKSFDASSWFASLKRGSKKNIAQDVFQDDDAPPLPNTAAGTAGGENSHASSGNAMLSKPFEFLKRRLSMAHRSVRSLQTTDSRANSQMDAESEDVPPMPATTPFGQQVRIPSATDSTQAAPSKAASAVSNLGSGIKSFFSSLTINRKKKPTSSSLFGTLSKNNSRQSQVDQGRRPSFSSQAPPRTPTLEKADDAPPVLTLRHEERESQPVGFSSYLSLGRGRKSEKSLALKGRGTSQARIASPTRAPSVMSRADKQSMFRFGGESTHFFGSLFRKKRGPESTYSFNMGDDENGPSSPVPPVPPVPQSHTHTVDNSEDSQTATAPTAKDTPAEEDKGRKQLSLNTLKYWSKSTKSLLQGTGHQEPTSSSPPNTSKTPTDTIMGTMSSRNGNSSSSDQARLMEFAHSGAAIPSSSIADLPGQIDDVVEKVSWKGLFSVTNTSTRPPNEIASRLRLVLECLAGEGYYSNALRYTEKRGTMLVTLKTRPSTITRSQSMRKRMTLLNTHLNAISIKSPDEIGDSNQLSQPVVTRARAHTVTNGSVSDRLADFGLESTNLTSSPLPIGDEFLSSSVSGAKNESDAVVEGAKPNPSSEEANEGKNCPPVPEKDYPYSPIPLPVIKTPELPSLSLSSGGDLLNNLFEGRGREETKRKSARSIGVSLPPPRLRLSQNQSDFAALISPLRSTSRSRSRLSIFGGDANDRESVRRSIARRSRSAVRASYCDVEDSNDSTTVSATDGTWQAPDSVSQSSVSNTTVNDSGPNSISRRQSALLVQFQIKLCRITWIGLYGVQFHHLAGDSLAYKEVCEEILRLLCL